MNELQLRAAKFGVTVTNETVSNMEIQKIIVPDPAIKDILKTVQLNPEVQQEVVDKMIDRTPSYFGLTPEEQVDKIKVTLTIETVIEYLRLSETIVSGIDMIEVGIDKEGSIVITAFYVQEDAVTKKVFEEEMTEEQVADLETQMNIFDSEIDIYEEAKKRMEKMGKVVPFPNREQRREMKKKRGNK